jgi:hypothetical protein
MSLDAVYLGPATSGEGAFHRGAQLRPRHPAAHRRLVIGAAKAFLGGHPLGHRTVAAAVFRADVDKHVAGPAILSDRRGFDSVQQRPACAALDPYQAHRSPRFSLRASSAARCSARALV